jgi:carbon monoxide dehydrogenase subunit G
MELAHRFTVPIPVEEAWAHFNDVTTVAECFPGATVSSAEADSFSGSVKVKLGPIALLYNGSGTFVDKDDTAHRFVVEAKGKDKRGNGTAGATVTLSMTARGDRTDVEVLTDLAVTGKPAQFGRGVMEDVSDKLLGQFVDCLEQRFAPRRPAASSAPVPPTPAPVPQDAAPAPAPSPVAAAPPRPTEPASTPRPSDDAISLGSTVLPVLARTYWKPALVVVALVALLVWIVARR